MSLASLSWDALLKMSKVELWTYDIDIYNLFEMGTRGGMSCIRKRFQKANSKCLSDYDKSEESNYILYLDANSLYPTEMRVKLPVIKLKWKKED